MPPRVAVVERPSRCESCEGLPFCSRCGTLQDLPADSNHFRLFSLAPSLALDESALREAFYALSRKLHPDRFAVSSPEEQNRALRWTTALNRAYQALRDPETRSRYLLELHGSRESGVNVPAELAEAYFEADDLVSFREELLSRLASADADWKALSSEWSEKRIAELREIVDRKRYLRSMLNDLEAKLS